MTSRWTRSWIAGLLVVAVALALVRVLTGSGESARDAGPDTALAGADAARDSDAAPDPRVPLPSEVGSAQSEARARAAAQVAGSATLFSLVPGPGGCRWEVREMPDPDPLVLRTTARCPREILWLGLPLESDLIYEGDGELKRVGLAGGEESLPLPVLDGGLGSLVHFWIEEESERLRVGFMPSIPCVTEGRGCAYDLGVRTINSVRDDEGWERFAIQDGWAVAPGGEGGGRVLPPWGTQGVAVVYEEDTAGGWTMVSAAPTRSEAGETPGLDVLSIARASGVVALATLGSATTCQEQRLSSTGCEPLEGPVPDWLAEHPDIAFDEVASVSSEGGRWVFPVLYGDTPHAIAPVFIECGPDCEATPLRLPDPNLRQLALSVSGPYLLAGREYSRTEGAVFAPGSAEPVVVLPPQATSVWLPR